MFELRSNNTLFFCKLRKAGQLAIPKTIAEEPFEGVQLLLTLDRNIQHKLYLAKLIVQLPPI